MKCLSSIFIILIVFFKTGNVLSSEKTYTIKEFIEKCFHKINIEIEWEGKGLDEIGRDKSNAKVLIAIDEKYFRPCEVDLLLGDCSKAKDRLKWVKEYDTIDKLIDSMLNDEWIIYY